ncbi:tetratricopeptide repeat protein [Thermococcus zilligii]|uniref:hypothetical protein n=1 Tax=Thermococcus zilligii TaxID=54076 RepID=UPI00029B2492|nr:hypothetical protein [Thermococcus zilligii]
MDERLIEIKRLLNGGNPGAALALAGNIKDPYWRDYALKWIAEAYAMERPEKALEVAESISTESLRDETLRDISYVFSKSGLFRQAILAAGKIKSEFTRKKALKAVSAMLARAIVEKHNTGVSLSELGLDEGDIELLKPLPYGISLKDGKLMPGSELLRMKGEFRNAVVPQGEAPGAVPPKPEAGAPGKGRKEYLIEYFEIPIWSANVEELEYWAGLLEEPLRSRLLEEAGVIYLKAGNFEKAEKLWERASSASELSYLLALHALDEGDFGKAPEFARKILSPVKKLLLLQKMLEMDVLDGDTLRKTMNAKSDYLLARALKSFAFELLGEAEARNDPGLRALSKRIFDLGVKIQREFEARALDLF